MLRQVVLECFRSSDVFHIHWHVFVESVMQHPQGCHPAHLDEDAARFLLDSRTTVWQLGVQAAVHDFPCSSPEFVA